MTRHVPLVASGFNIASFTLGLPALLGFLFFAFASLRLYFLTPSTTPESAVDASSLVGLLLMGARLFGKVIGVVGGVAQWMIVAAAVGFFIVLLYSGALFLTGRGLDNGRTWARISGILLVLGPWLASVLVFLSIRRGVPMAAATIAGLACSYVLWTLFWRFA